MFSSKQILRTLLSGIVLVLLASCAATNEDSGPNVVYRLPTDAEVEQHNALMEDPGDRIVCRTERQVRSSIPVRNCYLVRDLQSVSDFHRQELMRVLH